MRCSGQTGKLYAGQYTVKDTATLMLLGPCTAAPKVGSSKVRRRDTPPRRRNNFDAHVANFLYVVIEPAKITQAARTTTYLMKRASVHTTGDLGYMLLHWQSGVYILSAGELFMLR